MKRPADPKRQVIERKLGQLKTEGSTWLSRWRDLSYYITPYASRLYVTDRNRGTDKTFYILNETATIASDTLTAGMMSGMTSPARPWFKLTTMDPDLAESKAVRVYLDLVQQRLGDVFLRSNLYTVLPQVYSDLGVYGTGAYFVEKDDVSVIRCEHLPVGSYWLANSARGTVDTCYRTFMMTRRQLIQKFGYDACSVATQNAYDNDSGLETWVEVVHAVEPNEDYDHRKPLSKFKKFSSCYLERGAEADKLLRESGYDTFPIMAPRWSVTGEDVYGIGPGMKVLGVIKALQVREKRNDQAIEKMVTPPVNAPISLKNGLISNLPGGVTFVDSLNGNTVQPTYELDPAMLQPLQQSIEKAEKRIRTAFFADLFLMLTDIEHTGMTATEIMERKEEKMQVLGPVLDRQNDENLNPLIERCLGIMFEMNLLPPAPPELQGTSVNIEYISILAQARKLQNVSVIQQTAQYVQSLMPNFPDIGDTFDADESVEAFGGSIGLPPVLIRDVNERTAIRALRAKQQAAQQAMNTAQQGAQIVQKLGATQVTPDTALGQMAARMGAPQ